MGTYYNPGNESFRRDSNSRIYVDKTGLLKELNQLIGTSDCCISVSHARRFGKSQAAGMIDAYYSSGCDSKELFSGFEIAETADFEVHMNKYNVIHVDVSSVVDFHKEDIVEYLVHSLLEELQAVFVNIDSSRILPDVLSQVYRISGKQFVIILDEWDCVIRNCTDNPELIHRYLQLLHALFKSEESKRYLALTYITGILPIKKVKDESAMNNFREYSMISSKRFTRYFGFTDTEVRALCERYNMEYDSVRKWYNGYLIDGIHMYNPNSVSRAMTEQSLESYWKNTSSFETINDLIAPNMEGMKDSILAMLKGERVRVNANTFRNDLSIINSRDDALTALIHLGYLGYDIERQEAFVPNFEVALAYEAALSSGAWKEIAKTISRCEG